MVTSEQGKELIQGFEKCRLKAYPDSGSVWTIGWGNTEINGVPVTKGMVITQEEADAEFAIDLEEFEGYVNVLEEFLTQQQFDALVAFAFNVGGPGFKSSTIYRKVKANQADSVTESNFTVWNKIHNAQGVLVALDGLTRRRKAEYHLYRNGEVKFEF